MKNPLLISILVILVASYFFLPEYIARMNYPLKYQDLIVEKANQSNLSPALLASLVYNESRYNKEAISPRDAYGLAQVQLPTAKDVSDENISKEDLFDPEINLELGAKYLSQLIDRYKGDKVKAIIAYNLGPTRLDKGLKDGLFIEQFEDSYNFAKKVLAIEKVYGSIYSDQLEIEPPYEFSTFNIWSSLFY
jgi:soluble lytic murein transglycosylase